MKLRAYNQGGAPEFEKTDEVTIEVAPGTIRLRGVELWSDGLNDQVCHMAYDGKWVIYDYVLGETADRQFDCVEILDGEATPA